MHIISIGNIIDPEQAVVLRGPRLGGIIKQFINDCIWPALDYMIIDLPPGTGDIQLTLVQSIPLTGVVMVTTPQEVAYIDAVKAMNMFLLDNVNVPILGIVENMALHVCSQCGHQEHIFGEQGGERIAQEYGVPLLGSLPLQRSIREQTDSGNPTVAAEPESAVSAIYLAMADKIAIISAAEALSPSTYAYDCSNTSEAISDNGACGL